ncbi:MAG: hypothetical protein J6W29_01430 [Neisseriaceae bacterium]|nr:hypothetical protein [Neisseriaceae bacterium]
MECLWVISLSLMSKKQAKPPTNIPPFSGSLNAVSGCFVLMFIAWVFF